jgi:hypothetical protein
MNLFRAFKMSDKSEAPSEDESSMYTLKSSVIRDVLLKATNDVEDTNDVSGFDEFDSQNRKRLREVNADEASTLTFNTTMTCKVLGEQKNDTVEMDNLSQFDSAISWEDARLNEINPEVMNTLETRVQNKREKSRAKYNCGKCRKEKKNHICDVDQIRAGRRWYKQNVWTQTLYSVWKKEDRTWVI